MKTSRWLVRLYPRAWRERYGEEFLEVLSSQPLTLVGALDVLRGALRERVATTALPASWPEAVLPALVLAVALLTPSASAWAGGIFWAYYGALPEFHRAIVYQPTGPLCVPASALRLNAWLVLPMLAVLLRAMIAGGPFEWSNWMAQTKVRTWEFGLWLPLVVVGATVQAVLAHAETCFLGPTSGWLQSFSQVLQPGLWLWWSSQAYRHAVRRARDARPQPPASFRPLGLA